MKLASSLWRWPQRLRQLAPAQRNAGIELTMAWSLRVMPLVMSVTVRLGQTAFTHRPYRGP
jgi:hypothetical protein